VHLPYEQGLDEKYRRGVELLEQAGVTHDARLLPPEKSPRPLEYRSLFKLAVRPSLPGRLSPDRPALADDVPSRFALGLFAPGSHDVIDMHDCPLHTAPLRKLIRDLRTELDLSPLTPYSERTHSGQIRYVVARAAHLTGEIMLTFVVTEPLKPELRQLVQNLQRQGDKINSAYMNINSQPGNAIFGPETIRVAGADKLRERLCDLDFEVGPTAFFQINPWQAINLYRRVEQIAGPAAPDAVAWDLYCGVGQIALVLARLGYRTFGVEENPTAILDAQANARKNHLSERTEFVQARVEDVTTATIPAWATKPGLIVVNPSRRGLAEETRAHLARLLADNKATRLIYVSCSVQTLARDLADLTRDSGFQVRQIEAFDMFPQTDNMEWLVVMSHG